MHRALYPHQCRGLVKRKTRNANNPLRAITVREDLPHAHEQQPHHPAPGHQFRPATPAARVPVHGSPGSPLFRRLTLSRSRGCVQQAAPQEATPPKYQRETRRSAMARVVGVRLARAEASRCRACCVPAEAGNRAERAAGIGPGAGGGTRWGCGRAEPRIRLTAPGACGVYTPRGSQGHGTGSPRSEC
ncbi:hypothetical protein NDU88_007167 [Pleurodeles waltl]|uniref:Uncharacterized protein n=1 Tax=Pleurodeles waltl TaxID=8319 RepID=A0AAV7PNH6_PLEWA|nr:hypothetical protein NDU88_007167 [Pleurodeles waltl]